MRLHLRLHDLDDHGVCLLIPCIIKSFDRPAYRDHKTEYQKLISVSTVNRSRTYVKPADITRGAVVDHLTEQTLVISGINLGSRVCF